jgi:hypothetical protein
MSGLPCTNEIAMKAPQGPYRPDHNKGVEKKDSTHWGAHYDIKDYVVAVCINFEGKKDQSSCRFEYSKF